MRMRVASGMRVVMSSPLHTPFSETVPRVNRQARIEKAEVARLQIRQLHTGPASTTITMGVLVVSPDGQPVVGPCCGLPRGARHRAAPQDDRQIGGPRALQDAGCIGAALPKRLGEACAIAHQTANLRKI